jgi:hypothetical protein
VPHPPYLGKRCAANMNEAEPGHLAADLLTDQAHARRNRFYEKTLLTQYDSEWAAEMGFG